MCSSVQMSSLIPKRPEALRRTFAIISHPDAGKTTITERLLFAGGELREMGHVKAKAGKKFATSDWMTIEQDRGISVSSSVLQFNYRGLKINILDTPGHKDFSEDTYRTLVAADSALMLIDGAKGIEDRTEKLYEVCRYRKIPIFTFINKCDREGKPPLELMDEIESRLKIRCYPINWPLGMGSLFTGIYSRIDKKILLFDGKNGNHSQHTVDGLKDPRWSQWVHPSLLDSVLEEVELVDLDRTHLDQANFLQGVSCPLFWGSAQFYFGVKSFLDYFSQSSVGPGPRRIKGGHVCPEDSFFSGFVFKIQANMDPKHRDRVAYIRVCSGRFSRGMKVYHMRLGRQVRLSHSSEFLAQDRQTLVEAYPGDIVGVTDSGLFQIGDSLSEGPKLAFEKIPRFPPEVFSWVRVSDAMKRKKLQKALDELSQEGTVQIFLDPEVGSQEILVGVVGELQLDVLKHRLSNEYSLSVSLDRTSYKIARWPRDSKGMGEKNISGVGNLFCDSQGEPVVLLESPWDLNWLEKENPRVVFGSLFELSREDHDYQN